jgi:hypothetical protein
MNLQIPNIVFPIITLTIATVIALYSWRRSRTVAIVALIWAVISLFTARIPFFQNPDQWTDGDLLGFMAFGSFVMIPVVLCFVVLWQSSAFQQFMNNTPSWVLTATQVYRLTGAGFLLLYLQGLLPTEIGLVNGVLDIVVGVTALPVAWTLARGFPWSRNLAIVWNIVGIFDLASAFTVVTLSIFGLIDLVPAPARMGLYPLSIISVYQVAIAIFIHIYLLRRLIYTEPASFGQSNA